MSDLDTPSTSRFMDMISSTQQQFEAFLIDRDSDAQEHGIMQHDIGAMFEACRMLEDELWTVSNETAAIQKKFTENSQKFKQETSDHITEMCDAVAETIDGFRESIKAITDDTADLRNKCSAFDWDDLEEQCMGIFGNVDYYNERLESYLCIVQSIQVEISVAVAESLASEAFECPICMTEHTTEDVFIVTSCGHKFCRACAQYSVNNNLNTGEIPLVCPQCKAEPCSNCPVKRENAGSQVGKHCQLFDSDLELLLEPDVYARYIRVQLTIAVNTSNGELVLCPKDGCHNVVGRDPEDPHCNCMKCNHQWCESCHVDWHKGSTCEAFQKWKKENEQGDEIMEKMKQDGLVKQCPNCQNYGSMGAGECNATTCLLCRKAFCWLCGISLGHLKDPHSHFGEPGPCYAKVFHGVHK